MPSARVTRRAPPGASKRLEIWVSPEPCQRSRAISSPTTSSPSSRETWGAQRGRAIAVTRRASSGSSSGTAWWGERPKSRVSPDPSVTVGRPEPRSVTRSTESLLLPACVASNHSPSTRK